jgi:hypothetical protein
MATHTVDPVLEKWLKTLKEVTEIRDVDGKVLGTFTPAMSAEEIALYERAKQLFDADEIERILRDQRGQGVPLAEFWKQMESTNQQ